MTKFIPFEEDHVKDFGESQVIQLLKAIPVSQRRHIYSVTVDGGLCAIGAVHIIIPGVARAWFNATFRPLDKGMVIQVVRGCIDQLSSVAKAEKLRRVEATTIVGKKRELRFMEALGFNPEGIMRCYGSVEEDHILWSKLYA